MMLNKVFFITDNIYQVCENAPAEENFFYSVLVDPAQNVLENIYAFIDNAPLVPVTLTLNIEETLSEEVIKFITSFLFLPSYAVIEWQPVINLTGKSGELMERAASELSLYFSQQGFHNAIINKLSDNQAPEGYYQLFQTIPGLQDHYRRLLRDEDFYNVPVFFRAPSPEMIQSVLLMLHQEETSFRQGFHRLFSLAKANQELEVGNAFLRRKAESTETELANQRKFNAILRSAHSTKELQRYYDQEYEVLPLWYKRVGHLIKVLTGKRTFKSLFRDDVKKYKE